MSLFWVRAFMVMCNLCLSLVIVNIKILSSFTTFEISQNLACGKVKNVMSASEHPILYDFFSIVKAITSRTTFSHIETLT